MDEIQGVGDSGKVLDGRSVEEALEAGEAADGHDEEGGAGDLEVSARVLPPLGEHAADPNPSGSLLDGGRWSAEEVQADEASEEPEIVRLL